MLRNGSGARISTGPVTITPGETGRDRDVVTADVNARRGSFAYPSSMAGGRVVTASLELRAQQDRVTDYVNQNRQVTNRSDNNPDSMLIFSM